MESYGFSVYYELLSLDQALASEEASNQQYSDDFGDDFPAYLASQLDIVRSTYARGSVRGTAYSVRAPTGEFSSSIPLTDLLPLTQMQFDAVKTSGWSASQA
jgi:hypothetical protein